MGRSAPAGTTASTTRLTWNHPAARSRVDDINAVPAVLRSEWIKLSSVRANKAILAMTTAVGGFVSWAVARFVTDEVQTVSGGLHLLDRADNPPDG